MHCFRPPVEDQQNHTQVSHSTDVATGDDVSQSTVVYADLDLVEFQAARSVYVHSMPVFLFVCPLTYLRNDVAHPTRMSVCYRLYLLTHLLT